MAMRFAILSLALLGALTAFAVYRLVTDAVPPVYEVYSHPVPVAAPVKNRKDIVDKPTAKAGESLYIYRESCWTKIVPGKIKRSLSVNGKTVFIFEVIPVGNVALGCPGIAGVLKLPAELPPEVYTLNASIEFAPNPFMTTEVHWGNVAVEIVP